MKADQSKKLNEIDVRLSILHSLQRENKVFSKEVIELELALLEEKERILRELADEENKEKVTYHLQRIEDLLRELITVTIQSNPHITQSNAAENQSVKRISRFFK